ncbi:hypothetical protein ABK040_002880 [Willaertia magna]
MSSFRCIVGTDTGLIKVLDGISGNVFLTIGEQRVKNHGVKKLLFSHPSSDSEFCALHEDSIIDFYFTSTGQRRFTMSSTLQNIQGIYSENISDETRNIYLCDNKGILNICQFPIAKYNTIQPSESFLDTVYEKQMKEVNNEEEGEEENKKREKKLNPGLGYKITEDVQTEKLIIEPNITESKLTGGNVGVMVSQRLDSKRLEIAIAGKDNLMKIFDAETQKIVFKSKNVPDDCYKVRQPIWDTDICYLGIGQDDKLEKMGQSFGNLICTSTAYNQVRFYDRRANERPIFSKVIEDHAITSIRASPNAVKEVIFGTCTGRFYRYNFTRENKQTRKFLYSFPGIAGGVREVNYHCNGEIVGCVSLDRYLRIYNQETRVLLHSHYLIQRLTSFLFTRDEYKIEKEEDDSDNDNEEEKDLFEGLGINSVEHEEDKPENINDTITKKRSKSERTANLKKKIKMLSKKQ